MDESGVMALIEELSDLIEDGKPALGNKEKCTIEKAPALEILEDIRHSFPQEFAHARQIVREQQRILEDAEAEANRIIEDARQQTLIIASEQEIVRIAQSQAEDVLADARDLEREMRAGAEDYADSVFMHIENTIAQISDNVHRCRERLNNKGGR
ncbi:MAG: ATPase [Coriobacteriales bacterium]|nr:ATPase [Coriobacteriales bacterium]